MIFSSPRRSAGESFQVHTLYKWGEGEKAVTTSNGHLLFSFVGRKLVVEKGYFQLEQNRERWHKCAFVTNMSRGTRGFGAVIKRTINCISGYQGRLVREEDKHKLFWNNQKRCKKCQWLRKINISYFGNIFPDCIDLIHVCLIWRNGYIEDILLETWNWYSEEAWILFLWFTIIVFTLLDQHKCMWGARAQFSFVKGDLWHGSWNS